MSLHRAIWSVIPAAILSMLLVANPALGGCNSGDTGKNWLLSTQPCEADASGNGAVAIGFEARALGHFTTAVGNYAGPSTSRPGATMLGHRSGMSGAGAYSTAVGGGDKFDRSSHALGNYSIAIGGGDVATFPGALAHGYRSVAIGQASDSADFGTSVGFKAVTRFASTAIGTDAIASGDGSTAFGRFSKAEGDNSVALGVNAIAFHNRSIAIGQNATTYNDAANSADAVAVGYNSVSIGNASAAFGRLSWASGTDSTALGRGAAATMPRSVALGSGSLANVSDTVSVGTNTARRRIVNVAPGKSNSDAATLGQVKNIATAAAVEVLSNETMAKAVAETTSGDLQRELREMQSAIKKLQKEIAELKGQKATALNQ